MTLQRVPLPALQKVQQFIREALNLPDSERRLESWTSPGSLEEPPMPESLDDLGDLLKYGNPLGDDLPEIDETGFWLLSAVNPAAALIKLPGLDLQPSWRLVSYLHRRKTGGISLTWAVPETLGTTAALEAAIPDSRDRRAVPRPDGVSDNFMDVIAGDRSNMSFLMASLLRREILDFGAIGADQKWHNHRLIAAVPPKIQWQWRNQAPKDLSPKVQIRPEGIAVVEFFSCRVKPPVVICRHLDQYPADRYSAQCKEQAIAMAPSKRKKLTAKA